jgi:hypothetical protein
MPRTNVPVNDVTRAGIFPTEVNADTVNNHEFDWGPTVILVARNSAATATRNVTLVFPPEASVDGQAPTNRVVGVPVSTSRYIGPFPQIYRTTDGKVHINVEHADLRLVALRVP